MVTQGIGIGIGFQRGTHTRWKLVTNDGIGAPTLAGMGGGRPQSPSPRSYAKDGKVVTGGVGDMTLVHADLGWRRVETDFGYAIEFETGEELRYGVVKEGVGSANINLDTLVLDGAQGDDRANSLIATGHSRSVQISGGDGGDGNDVLRRRRGMIPGWPGQPRAGGGLDVQCGSGRPLPVAGNG